MEFLAIWLTLAVFAFYIGMRIYFSAGLPGDEDEEEEASVWDFVVVGPIVLMAALLWPLWPVGLGLLYYLLIKKR